MRKWVVGILAICFLAIVAQEFVDSVRPRRPDEEQIVNAVFKPDRGPISRLKNLVEPSDEKIAVEADWTSMPEFRTFDQAVDHGIHELEELLHGEERVLRMEEGDPKEVAVAQRDVDETLNSLKALKEIRENLRKQTESVAARTPVPLRSLRVNPNINLFVKKADSLFWKVTLLSGGTTEVYSTRHLAYPLFSKDGNYACLRETEHTFHFSPFVIYYFLKRTRSDWKVVAWCLWSDM